MRNPEPPPIFCFSVPPGCREPDQDNHKWIEKIRKTEWVRKSPGLRHLEIIVLTTAGALFSTTSITAESS
jgi:hypothetical protein